MRQAFYDDKDILSKYLKDVREYDVLEADKQVELVIKAQKGDEKARNLLISTNLRFVMEVIKRYKYSGVSVQELISEGNFGLFEAIERFDVKRQNHFISYAVWWIRYYVIRAIQKYSTGVRIPANKKREIVQIKKLEQENYYKGEMNSSTVLKQIQDTMGVSEKYILQLQNLSRDVDSIDQVVEMGDNGRATYEDILEDSKVEDPYLFALRGEEFEVLLHCLENIPEREAEIIKKRYGINGIRPRSLQDLSEEYGLTKERIRQLEIRGICRMRSIVAKMKLLEVA